MTDTIPIMDNVNLTIRIDKDMRAKVERLSELEDRSVSATIRVLLAEALAAREAKGK